MKKLFFILLGFMLCITAALQAQVTIGSNVAPDKNALLDLKNQANVDASTKGLLLPRVKLTSTADAAPLTAHTYGMIVFNTAKVNDVDSAFYYNDGKKWVRITDACNFWGLKGNAATDSATNFIGTTDPLKPLIFRTNNTPRMIVSSNGKVGIGTTTPFCQLQVNGGVRANKGAPVNVDNSNVGYSFGLWDGDTGMFAVNGNPSQGSDINFYIDNSFRFSIRRDNQIATGSGAWCTGAGVWANASDARLKTNIENCKYGLKEILLLHPVQYSMKTTGEKQIGFIAQEVRNIIPEVISGIEGDIEKGETLALAYGNMAAVLTKAIQDQQRLIERLQSENEMLKKRLEAIEVKLK